MKLAAVLATLAPLAVCLAGVAAAAPPEQCEVPQSLIGADAALSHVLASFKTAHRVSISVIGSGSSGLSGPDGTRSAYPARLEDVLKQSSGRRRHQGHRTRSIERNHGRHGLGVGQDPGR